ncbi:unnamed protein product [Amoebophrya sp. A25]|nr:unnamed protein product [Amoebophrya sp. A25]|eukprot:GSA25T00027453001.1
MGDNHDGSPSGRFASRKQQFKQGLDLDEARRSRIDDEVQIRKAEKAMLLAQKRSRNLKGAEGASAPDSTTTAVQPTGETGVGAKFSNSEDLRTLLPQLVQAIFNDGDRETQHEAVVLVRKLLSKEENPPIEEVVEAALTPKLVDLMRTSTDPKLTLETAWAVTNIASGDSKFTKFVVDAGGIDAFLSILQSKQALRQELCEQAVWGLGNIAGDGALLRDQLVDKGIIKILQNICSGIIELPWKETEKENNLKNVLWVMTNCCRGKPAPEFQKIEPALSVFAEVVGRKMKDSLASEALWGIFYAIQSNTRQDESHMRLNALLLAGQQDRSTVLVEGNPLVRCLVAIIEPKVAPEVENGRYTGRYILAEGKEGNYTKDIRIPALKALGELISAEPRCYTDVSILSGIVPAVLKMLRLVDHAQARKEGCWLVSNLLAALQDQVLAAIMPYDLSAKSNLNDLVPPQDSPSEPLPPPTADFQTMFDVMFELSQQLQHNESWNKMKYDSVKELVYCYTNYFATNEIGSIKAHLEQYSGAVPTSGTDEVLPLRNVFKLVGEYCWPYYDAETGYGKVPDAFVHHCTFFLNLFQSRQWEPTLLTNMVDAAQKLLNASSNPNAEALRRECMTCGFAERIDDVITRLQQNRKSSDALLEKLVQFKNLYFPDDDLDDDHFLSEGGGLLSEQSFGQGMEKVQNFDFS